MGPLPFCPFGCLQVPPCLLRLSFLSFSVSVSVCLSCSLSRFQNAAKEKYCSFLVKVESRLYIIGPIERKHPQLSPFVSLSRSRYVCACMLP